ncbi:hypothetical protein P0136_11460 [Lentisphaerota bacterium ZTH]|nr:hypothetical protein JYG24_11020 [Lentisphaerota bacterium]WET05974.1 hypothetical protein P0136_11460 [Lentisphaerota bacterium ZTH]
MNKVVALDIGGVCMQLDPRQLLRTLGIRSLEEVTEEMWGISDLLETGKISEEEWIKVVSGIAPGNPGADEIREAWNTMISHTTPGMPELARELVDAGYRLVYFSDTSTIHIREVSRKLSFAHLITGGIFSFEVGAKKPGPEMYQAFEEKFGRPCIYADDRLNNIESGTAKGWNSHLFTTTESFRKALMEAELL